MQSPEDLPTKVSKPKPNNKTKTWAKKRTGEDFKSKSRTNSLSEEKNINDKNTQQLDRVTQTVIKNNIENKNNCDNHYKEIKSINKQKSTIKIRNSGKSCESPQSLTTSLDVNQNKRKMNSVQSREEIVSAKEVKRDAKTCNKSGLNGESKKNMVTKSQQNKIIAKEDIKNDSNKKETFNSNPSINLEKLQNEVDIKHNHVTSDKSREQILIERQAKKLAKQAQKLSIKSEPVLETCQDKEKIIEKKLDPKTSNEEINKDKSREDILAEREAKKLAKQAAKNKSKAQNSNEISTVNSTEIIPLENATSEKKAALSKAERRSIQEAQRAAKAKILEEKQKNLQKQVPTETTKKDLITSIPKNETSPKKEGRQLSPSKFPKSSGEYKVKLFKHLDREDLQEKNQFINNSQIHPAIVQLGEQFATRTVVGSNARCIAFLKALKNLIQDYETPAKKEFARSLEKSINNCVQYLHKCRPLAVSVTNAHKAIQSVLRHLKNDLSESESKKRLCEHIDVYIEDQIEKAAKAISGFVQEKISNGDVILTFGCSSLIYQIFEEAHDGKKDFRVVVVDSRPFCEGQELLRKLALKEIPCSYVLINAVGFIMPEVTKILMGAHALLANGNVMARTGTAQVALVAKSFNVPVLVCCETYKFSERVQTDAIVYNELGNPDDLVTNNSCKLANWQKGAHKILPLNLNYDITPPELVTAVVTEVAILPCTSVPVILRLKPTDIPY